MDGHDVVGAVNAMTAAQFFQFAATVFGGIISVGWIIFAAIMRGSSRISREISEVKGGLLGYKISNDAAHERLDEKLDNNFDSTRAAHSRIDVVEKVQGEHRTEIERVKDKVELFQTARGGM